MTNYKKNILLLIMAPLIIGCTNKRLLSCKELSKEDPHHINYSGSIRVGGRYKIKNKIYTPKMVKNYCEVGMASWYGARFHNKKTATGERFNKNCLTAAHPTLPLPSLVQVQNLQNNRAVILLVNDRGPFSQNRLIDVSERAASVLGFKSQGVAKVSVKYLHKETENLIQRLIKQRRKKIKVAENNRYKKCSVNCQVKLINMKYGYPFELN